MSVDEMPLKHDILAEHLYAKIEQLQDEQNLKKCSVAQLTGILLDGGDQNVFRMLEDKHYLREAVDNAIKITVKATNEHDETKDKESCEDDASIDAAVSSKQDLCDELFEKVQQLEPELTSQITGMLAELDRETVLRLLENESMLLDAITRAKLAYTESAQSSSAGECNNNTEPVESLGDVIYDKCHHIFPQHAAQITGMLLEMETSSLQSVISDSEMLVSYIHKAHSALLKYNTD